MENFATSTVEVLHAGSADLTPAELGRRLAALLCKWSLPGGFEDVLSSMEEHEVPETMEDANDNERENHHAESMLHNEL